MQGTGIIIKKTRSNHWRSVISGSIGNLIEWYDWAAYSIFTLYFAASFFPEQSQTAQLLNTAGIFAIGFLMRPVGGWLLGVYADRKGRKAALTLSVLLMSGGSMLIAVTPDFKTIGIAAPLLLVLARMLQGISVGGEYGTAATYLSEIAPVNRRGLYSSFQYVTTTLGQLLAFGILFLLQSWLLKPGQLTDWGWRIPFAIGAVLSLSAIYLRRSMDETESFAHEKVAERKRGSFNELVKYKRELLIVIGITLGGTVCYYTFSNYMLKFLVNTSGFSKSDSASINIIALLVFMIAQPFAGLLGDVVEKKKIMIIYGVLTLVTSLPMLTVLSNTHNFWTAAAIITLALLIQSLSTSISAVIKAELFPVNVRSLGVGLPYALTVALFGGSAEYIALGFKQAGNASLFFWYLTVCVFISLAAAFYLPGSRKSSRL